MKDGRNIPGTGNSICEVPKQEVAWRVEHLKVVLKGWSLERELKLTKDEGGVIYRGQIMKDL